MRSPCDHVPIVNALEVAGVEVREKLVVQGPGAGSSTSSDSTSVVDNDIAAGASTSHPPWTPTSTVVSFSSETPSTRWAFTPSDEEDISPGPKFPIRVARPSEFELPTPKTADEAEWMVCRSLSLIKIQKKKEARRRGMS
jgi:hypothetical protein